MGSEDTKHLQRRPGKAETIEAPDDTPKPGDWLEFQVTEEIGREEDEFDDYAQHYNDSDGPVISIEEVYNEEYETTRKHVTRWIFCAVTYVGSNYLRLEDLCRNTYRVHLDEWQEECRRVEDPDARIQQSVAYWQQHLTDATNQISALMTSLGVEGRQLAPDTEAIAVRVGSGPAEEHKGELVCAREQLPALYKRIEKAGKEVGKWLSARALPLRATQISLKERQSNIDSRLLAIDLYTGMSEDAKQVRKGKPADFHAKLHLMQRMHYMDEECLTNYQHGCMDFNSLGKFDRWLRKSENLKRILPHDRCAVAFRVRRNRKHRTASSWADFIRISLQEEEDKKTFLYVRNGAQLWRITCNHDFGEELFPDMAHTTIAAGERLWAPRGSSHGWKSLRTEGDLEQAYGEEWREVVQDKGFEPFNDSSVYYDDVSRSIGKMMGDYNRVAVLLQGMLDRSSVLHPHPKVRLWNADDFSRFVVLSFDKDHALTSGEAPDFKEYRARLAKGIGPGSYTIGQERLWWLRELEKYNERQWRSDRRIYSDNEYWSPNGDKGPGFVAEVKSVRGGKAKFEWQRQGRRQITGSSRWDQNYPIVGDSIRVPTDTLFNVSAYKPGDYKQFFNDPRTRAEYLEWAPFLLAAEEWHAQGKSYRGPFRRGKS